MLLARWFVPGWDLLGCWHRPGFRAVPRDWTGNGGKHSGDSSIYCSPTSKPCHPQALRSGWAWLSALTIKVHQCISSSPGLFDSTIEHRHHHASVSPTHSHFQFYIIADTSTSHLLGKKSWNVYNPANIARVRRDEAAAEAREHAEEQRMQEIDAARRLAILRGEIPPPLEDQEPPEEEPRHRSHDDQPAHGSTTTTTRKRKRPGEDDTDFEMRLARERASTGAHATRQLAATVKPPSHSTAPASLVDSTGHITLFAEPETNRRPREGNAEAARDAARKERELKDQYQMRLVNAAGRDGQGLTDGGPWYAASGSASAGQQQQEEVPGKDVWGREDPGRKDRQAARLGASDPLGMMKRGARMVRELERERRREGEEREREMRGLEREERRRERKRRREEDGDRSGRDREGTRRDRSAERSRHRRSRRDSPDRDGSAKQRDRPRRDHQDRHRHRSQERERRRDDEGERRPHRDDGKGSDRDRERRPHRDAGRDRDRDKDRQT